MARKLRVLVADDWPVNLRVAVRVLRELGHGGVVVADGEQALRALKSQVFDLVLLDVSMPGLDGLEVLRRIRRGEAKGAHHLPVVMVTGNDQPEEHDHYVREGAAAVIVKPLTVNQLKAVLEKIKPGVSHF